MGGLIRLDKYLGEMGLGTRSQLKEAARKGRILVNGQVEKRTDRKISPESDQVCVDGRTIAYAEMEYYMLNKPRGVVSARSDNLHQTVVELIEDRMRDDLFPVGRLDIDTEGLLLITNDGDLAHRMLSPRRHVDKVYYARIEGVLPADAAARFERGITLCDGTPALPAVLEVLKASEAGAEILLTIQEGKFHQVKRMFEAIACRVVYLKRLSMGPLKLDETLKPGEYRALEAEELHELKMFRCES